MGAEDLYGGSGGIKLGWDTRGELESGIGGFGYGRLGVFLQAGAQMSAAFICTKSGGIHCGQNWE